MRPLPAQRAEKLLKPLPDKPLPCDKLPDGPEPVQVEVEYVAREDLQVRRPGPPCWPARRSLCLPACRHAASRVLPQWCQVCE